MVHFIEERFFSEGEMLPVYYQGTKIGSVGWSKQNAASANQDETALSVKLRVQDQLGFPVYCVVVKYDGKSLGNNKCIENTDKIKIEVS